MGIIVNHLSVSYGDQLVLKNISLDFHQGDFISLIGPNGCGKSTLLKSMLQLKKVDQGETLLDGVDLKKLSSKQRAKRIAFLPQSPEIHDDISVRDFVALGRYHNKKLFRSLSQEDYRIVYQAIDWVGLKDNLHDSVLSLSGGQRQRVFLAMVLAQDTEYIFLDEPTSYLDVNHQIEFIELLKRLQKEFNKTIIIVLHDLPLVSKYSDSIVALKDGEVHSMGTPSEVFTEEMLSQVFSVCATLCPIKNSSQVMSYDYRKIGS